MEKNSAVVSIVVPVYGTEPYLAACVDSLRGQTYPHIQIILVDDQSPDRCPEMCDHYAQKDERIIVIHQKNKGVSGARNAGLRSATGEYVMFVDSDDSLYLDAVETLLKDSLNTGADIVSATKKVVDEKGRTVSACEDGACAVFYEDEAVLLSLEGDRNTNSACAKLFKKEFIKDVFFEEGKNINEDGFFVFQCYMRKPILLQHNVTVYQYNVRKGSNSRQIFSDKHLSMLQFCNQKKALVKAHFPQYIEQAYNMEVRTNLQFLDVLCRTSEKKYKEVQAMCIKTIRRLYMYHKPINVHHKKLAWIVVHGLFPIYKAAVRFMYYR